MQQTQRNTRHQYRKGGPAEKNQISDWTSEIIGPIARRLRVRTTDLEKDKEESEPTQEDFWSLEDDEERYFKAWKEKYNQIHKGNSLKSP